MCACDYTARPILSQALAWVDCPPRPTLGTGLNEVSPLPATLVLGGLPLTYDDFRTHHAS